MKTLALLTLAALCVPLAQADFIDFTGSQGSLAAKATFDFTGNTLTITLTNTAATKSTVSSAALSGIFFNLQPDAVLTPVSATVAPGSSIIQTAECDVNCVGVTDVGGEFAYATGVTGREHGISSSGYIGGGSPKFGATDLDAPASPNGINFGIVTSNFNNYDGNGGLDNDPLIRNSVVLTLTGVSGLTASSVSNVLFTYGTSLTEPTIPGTPGPRPPQGQIPEPTSMALLGTIAGVALLLRNRMSA